MELSTTFRSNGWAVKYHFYEPQAPSPGPLTTVVFVHGTPWSSDVFYPIAKALLARKQYRVLLYDLPGYGRSQAFESNSQSQQQSPQFVGDTSVKTQAAVLTDLLQHLHLDGKAGNEAPSVIAHDIAGTIALRAHLIHGCEFRSLLLLDTNTVLPWGDGFYKLVRSKPNVFLELPHGIYEAMVRAVIRSATFNHKVLLPDWEDTLARPWIGNENDDPGDAAERQKSFVRQISQANDADVAEMLDADMYANVRCDVKIIWGEHDQWIPREKMDVLAAKLGSRLKGFVVVPEAGHLVMLDQPEMVAVEAFQWLNKRRECSAMQ